MEEHYDVVYRGTTYRFTGVHYEYVIGKRDELPKGLNEQWTYMIKFARQKCRREQKAAHRNKVRGTIKVVK